MKVPVDTVALSSLALDTDIAPVLSAGRPLPPARDETLHHGALAVHLRELAGVAQYLLSQPEIQTTDTAAIVSHN